MKHHSDKVNAKRKYSYLKIPQTKTNLFKKVIASRSSSSQNRQPVLLDNDIKVFKS